MSTRRLRLVLALLAAALLLPSALLVERALRGVGAEQAARHRAVAERVFDEMERTLSDLVAREEERPVEAWSTTGAARLAEPPADAFVLGYFQVEPDGRITTPLPARDPDALRAATRAFAAAPKDAPAGERDAKAKSAEAFAQAPGTTVDYEKKESALAAPSAPSPTKNAYDALSSLNRGAEERQSRQRKVVEKRAEAEPSLDAGAVAEALADAGGADRRDATRVAVDPLVGRIAAGRYLLLYRSVFTDSAALRQGLVLDVDGLGAHLRERALGANRLAGAVLSFSSEADAAPPLAGDGAYVYRHRFAEPFDALNASLLLAPLEGGSGAGAIYALAALLAVAGGVGLFAVHRMVTIAMAFAERRSNFVAAVTHELKTPLTAIRMYGEMLRDDLVPSEAKRREYYGTITTESERLGRLIDNVLEFSRLEKGTREMRLTVGPLGPVVAEIAELLRPLAERAGFALRVEVEPVLPPVRYDRDALLQVLWNLVDNALKYAARGHPREIAIAVRSHDEKSVVLAVRDHGPGVPSRELARIFEPFHRGEEELVRTAQGTGLGLALAKSLIERMGGAVGGRNAAGGGFEVSIALPRATA